MIKSVESIISFDPQTVTLHYWEAGSLAKGPRSSTQYNIRQGGVFFKTSSLASELFLFYKVHESPISSPQITNAGGRLFPNNTRCAPIHKKYIFLKGSTHDIHHGSANDSATSTLALKVCAMILAGFWFCCRSIGELWASSQNTMITIWNELGWNVHLCTVCCPLF